MPPRAPATTHDEVPVSSGTGGYRPACRREADIPPRRAAKQPGQLATTKPHNFCTCNGPFPRSANFCNGHLVIRMTAQRRIQGQRLALRCQNWLYDQLRRQAAWQKRAPLFAAPLFNGRFQETITSYFLRRPGGFFPPTVRLRAPQRLGVRQSLPSSSFTPRAMAPGSRPAWKQVKSGRSRQA